MTSSAKNSTGKSYVDKLSKSPAIYSIRIVLNTYIQYTIEHVITLIM